MYTCSPQKGINLVQVNASRSGQLLASTCVSHNTGEILVHNCAQVIAAFTTPIAMENETEGDFSPKAQPRCELTWAGPKVLPILRGLLLIAAQRLDYIYTQITCSPLRNFFSGRVCIYH